MRAFFISDVHLSDTTDDSYPKLLEFLDRMEQSKADYLFIVGDLFEILTGNTNYVQKKFSTLFDKFNKYINSGGKIFYLFGNHDFNFSLKGFNVTESIPEISLGKFKCCIFHGDGLDPLDYKYRFLKSILRNSLFNKLSKIVPGSLQYKLGSFFSLISRKANGKTPILRKKYLIYRDYALQKLKETNLDVYIMAHTHVAELISFTHQNSTKYYMNTGSFSMSNSYGMIDDNGIYLLTL